MNTDLVFRNESGVAVTTSFLVAETFEKEHKHVVRDIDNLIEKMQVIDNQCSPNLSGHQEMFFEYFEDIPQPCGGVKPAKRYLMNRDGFTLLVMGYTGQKALEFKLKYIAAFNAMERQLADNAKDMAELTSKVDTLVEQLDYSKKLLDAQKEITRLNERIGQLDWEYTPHDREWWTMQSVMDPDSNLYPERMSFMEWMYDFCQSSSNVLTPVSANEILISWLIENNIVVTKQNLKRFRPMFRKAVEFFCDKYDYSLNPFYLFRTDRERREKAFYHRNLQTLFNGDRMIYPRQRKIYGVERCWVLLRKDTDPYRLKQGLREPTEYTGIMKPKNR